MSLDSPWLVPVACASLFAFGMATAKVNAAYEGFVAAGREPPRWLARLEMIRRYLAHED